MRIVILTLIALFCVIGCTHTPPAGSAQDIAAGEAARVEGLEKASDKADITAAASKARADELNEIALKEKTQKAIDAAAAAKVVAASDAAVAAALHKVTDEAQMDALKASRASEDERIKDAAAAEALWWKRITEISGAVGILAGVVVGGLMYYVGLRTLSVGTRHFAVAIGCILASAGVAVATFGAISHWMLPLLGVLIVLTGIVWAIHYVFHAHLLAETRSGLTLVQEQTKVLASQLRATVVVPALPAAGVPPAK